MGISGVSCFSEPLSTLTVLQTARIPQKRISYLIQSYCASSGMTLSDLFLINSSYVISKGQIQIDTDRDGIPDLFDIDPELGLTPYSAFSLPDGFGDLVAFASGATKTSQSKLMKYGNCTNPHLDSDGDGLSDCAETIILKTNPNNSDTDGDGIPDELELRFGLNPLDPSDARLSAAGDGITNLQKIKMQLPLRESATSETKLYAHEYELVPVSKNNLDRLCFDLKIKNIPIVNMTDGNLIISYISEKSKEGSSSRLNRCCSVVNDRIEDGAKVSVIWEKSPEFVCPCPLGIDLKR